MGYTTNFAGTFDLDRKLDDETYKFLKGFNEMRHMKRDLTRIMPKEEAEKYGVDGWDYVVPEDPNDIWYDKDKSIVDANVPPKGVPGLWCLWTPTEDGLHIVWDGCEKFYNYVEWIDFLIKNVLAPKGYVLNGEVEWAGEEPDDLGKIVVKDNVVKVMRARLEWDNP